MSRAALEVSGGSQFTDQEEVRDGNLAVACFSLRRSRLRLFWMPRGPGCSWSRGSWSLVYREKIKVIETGCIGSCDLGPIVVVYPEGVFYQKLKAEDARLIAEEHLFKGRVVERLLYTEPATTKLIPTFKEIDFFKLQEKIVLRNCGLIDPMNIEEYIAREGYEALAQVLTRMTPQEVVDAVQRSGLRGRGGAGFPTGTKWRFTQQAQGNPKYVVCNADEGDPGAFMDRSVLEGDPHSVIEAMTIAGYAIGSNQGYVYVRAEYPLAIERLSHAIEQARQYKFLGKNIFETVFRFRPGNSHRSRGVCLRRRDGADDFHRRKTGRTKAAPALPGSGRPVEETHPTE